MICRLIFYSNELNQHSLLLMQNFVRQKQNNNLTLPDDFTVFFSKLFINFRLNRSVNLTFTLIM